jgi:hypothetical protein
MAGRMKRTIVRYSVVAVVLAGGTFLVASQAQEDTYPGTVLGAPADPTPSPYHRVEEPVSVPDDPAPFVAPEPPVVADPAPSGQGVQLAPAPAASEPVVVETTPAPSTEPVTAVGTEPVVVERPRDGGIGHGDEGPAEGEPVDDSTPAPVPSPAEGDDVDTGGGVVVDEPGTVPDPDPGCPDPGEDDAIGVDPGALPSPSPSPSTPAEDDTIEETDSECVF